VIDVLSDGLHDDDRQKHSQPDQYLIGWRRLRSQGLPQEMQDDRDS